MKISVIIPVFNGGKWISRCLESVLNQEIACELEIIVVDDGSTDESLQIVKKIVESNSIIKIISTENKGVSNARNIGVCEAEGEYITFVDVDDYIEAGFFEDMMSEIDKRIDIICGGFRAEYTNGQNYRYRINTLELVGQKKLLEAFFKGKGIDVNVWGKLYKREIAKSTMFNTSYQIGEDKLYLFECLRKAETLSTISSSKYRYQIHDSSVMRCAFSLKKLDGLYVSEKISTIVKEIYPEISQEAESWLIDSKCRACGELLEVRMLPVYKELYKKLLQEVRSYSVINKYRNSNRKHFTSYIITCISPRLCDYIKKRLRFQYR